jgi:hypothetical protein
VTPNVSIPGNCGTAFLDPSAAAGHIHCDFGFDYLENWPAWVTANVDAINIDYGLVDHNYWSSAYFSIN